MQQRFIVLALSFLFFTGALHAQPITSGTEFVFAIPYNDGSQFATNSQIEFFVSSTYSDVSFTVSDEFGHSAKFRTGAAGSVFTVNRSTWPVIHDSLEVTQSESETIVRKAIRIVADQPVTVSVLNARAVSSDAWRPMPLHLWGTVYRAVSYWDFREMGGTSWAGGFLVVAGSDNTTVNINLEGVTDGSATTVKGRSPGQKITVTLNKGDVYSVIGDGKSRATFDLTGSLISANKPVSVIGFHARTSMPNCVPNGNGRDHLVENIPPVHAWSANYVTTSLLRQSTGQGKGDVFRIVGHEASTQWNMKHYDRATGQLIGQDGGVLQRPGDFRTIEACSPTALPSGIVVLTANKPVMLMQYATSASFDGDANADPFMIGVQGRSQFVHASAFQTPTSSNFTKHYLNLVVQAATEDDARSVTIDGIPVWNHPSAVFPPLLASKVSGSSDLYVTSISLNTTETSHLVETNGKASFAGYLHGTGSLDSYGYPVAGMQSIASFTDTIKPIIAASQVAFEYTVNVTEAEASGLESIVLTPTSRNARIEYWPNPVPAYRVTEPVNAASLRVRPVACRSAMNAVLQARDHRENASLTTLQLPAMTLSFPDVFDMGAVEPGQVIEDTVMVRNIGTETVVITSQVGFFPYGPGNGLSLTIWGWPKTVAPGDSVAVGVRYAPTKVSEQEYDTMVVVLNGCDDLRMFVRARCVVSDIVIADTGRITQEVAIGTSRCDTNCLTVKNTSAAPVTVVGVWADQHAELTVIDMPMIEFVLQPGETRSVGTVCYAPVNEGPDSTVVRVNTATNAWQTLIKRRAPIASSVTEPLDLPSDVTIVDHVVHAREHTYTVTVYDLLGRVLQTGVVRPGESLKIIDGYVVVQRIGER